ncbi:metal ABC transporter permease [candidate division WWE3 bacterium]|uniref:Metal ABC transporter permease n=1 Tax=candidate division WWE3 bacterium TaxID=2053526 RepID=A0A955RQN8_UNCKA|nr:metal ABC transporter permease [candidate division WWE3 bacterium]
MDNNLLVLLIVGALVGASSGFLGSFMVLKRMALVGDALSHVALPGMAIALTMAIDPMLGAFVALTAAVIGVWYLGEKTRVYSEALVGVFFTASLAIGILVTPEPELLEALFGSLDSINITDAVITVVAAVFIFYVVRRISKRLLLGVVSEDLAKSTGVNIAIVNLIYLFLVGLVVALGVKFLGTLLTGALVIVPAVAAKNMSRSLKSFQMTASIIGALSAVVGILVAQNFGISSGPVVVLISVAVFALSHLFRTRN